MAIANRPTEYLELQSSKFIIVRPPSLPLSIPPATSVHVTYPKGDSLCRLKSRILTTLGDRWTVLFSIVSTCRKTRHWPIKPIMTAESVDELQNPSPPAR